ncbi:hypothetical protein [Sphingopyxis panaciterrae]
MFDLFPDTAEMKTRAANELKNSDGDRDTIWRLRQTASENFRRAELAARDIGILTAELQEALDLERRLNNQRDRERRGR